MIYICYHCEYTTTRKDAFTRHKNRKNFCGRLQNDNENKNNEKSDEALNYNPKNNTHSLNYNAGDLNYNDNNEDKYYCESCEKYFTSKKTMTRHKKICKGVNKNTCPKCFKVFSSNYSKNNHIKYVNCDEPKQNNSNNTINNITNNISNSTINSNNNINIQNIVFRKEDLKYLEDADIIFKLNKCGRDGIPGISRLLKDVYYSKSRPQNNTIAKIDKIGPGLYIKSDSDEMDEWEYSEYEEIRDDIISVLDKHIDIFNDLKKKLNIEFTDKKVCERIKNLLILTKTIGGSVNEELYKELGLNMNSYSDEDEEDKINRKFDRFILDMLFRNSDVFFKRKGGKIYKKNSQI